MPRPVLTFTIGTSHTTTENSIDVKIDPEKPGQHKFKLTVVDEDGHSSEAIANVVVLAETEPTAVLNCEPAQVRFGQQFTLDGSGSSEKGQGASKITKYTWTMLS
jgi:hypothetical protein